MDVGWQLKIILLFLFFFLSAFFSGSEVALFSLDRKKLSGSTGTDSMVGRYLFHLLDFPRRLLVTILIGNTIVNVAASILAVSLTLDFAKLYHISVNLALTGQIIILTVLIILFGELIPKVWASRNPAAFAKIVAVPLYWLNVIIYPVAETLTELIQLSVSKVKFDKSRSAILPEEISELANLSHEKGALVEEEHGLINSIVSFRSVAVHEVMTPRVDMTSIQVGTEFGEVLDTITSTGHSRIPLYENDLDKIVGILYAKDLLPYVREPELRNALSLPSIARKAMFVPKTKMINDLMHEFQEKKMHIAIVVDEYGGTAGLITLEDILEEIIGEIRDEYDKEENPVIKIDDNDYIALGKLSVDELEELLNTEIKIEDNDFETLGGMVLKYAGRIPREGYSFKYENFQFIVKEIVNKRIKKVQIKKLPME